MAVLKIIFNHMAAKLKIFLKRMIEQDLLQFMNEIKILITNHRMNALSRMMALLLLAQVSPTLFI